MTPQQKSAQGLGGFLNVSLAAFTGDEWSHPDVSVERFTPHRR